MYVDSSALVKLAVDEPESEALSEALRPFASQASSVIATVEVPRAVMRAQVGPSAATAVAGVLGELGLVDLDRAVRERAAALRPAALRSLDAIHLASALALGDALEAVVTYDERLAEAAHAAGLTVLSPR